jgi:hypothetical protein
MDQTIEFDFSDVAGAGTSTFLYIKPSASVIDSIGDQVLTGERIGIQLTAGVGSVTIRPTDDTGLTPQGFTYQVTADFGTWKLNTHIAPVVADGSIVAFSDLMPVSSSGGVFAMSIAFPTRGSRAWVAVVEEA